MFSFFLKDTENGINAHWFLWHFGGLYRLVIISFQADYPHLNMLRMIMLHRICPRAWNDFSGQLRVRAGWSRGRALSQTSTWACVPGISEMMYSCLPIPVNRCSRGLFYPLWSTIPTRSRGLILVCWFGFLCILNDDGCSSCFQKLDSGVRWYLCLLTKALEKQHVSSVQNAHPFPRSRQKSHTVPLTLLFLSHPRLIGQMLYQLNLLRVGPFTYISANNKSKFHVSKWWSRFWKGKVKIPLVHLHEFLVDP